MISATFVSLCLLLSIKPVTGHSRNLVKPQFCESKNLGLGQPNGIMGTGRDDFRSDERSLTVMRNGKALKSGDSYIPGESVTLAFSPMPSGGFSFNQMEGAFQTTGGSFTGAPVSTGGGFGGGVGCTNNVRAFMFNPTLVIPADMSEVITLTSGWAVSPKTGPVTLAEPFLLMPPQPTMPPTPAPPTMPPTPAPTMPQISQLLVTQTIVGVDATTAASSAFRTDLLASLKTSIKLQKNVDLSIESINVVAAANEMAVVIYKMTVVNIETALLVTAANEAASANLLTTELQSKGYSSASASTLPQIMDRSPTSAPSVTPAAPSSGNPTVIAVTQVIDGIDAVTAASVTFKTALALVLKISLNLKSKAVLTVDTITYVGSVLTDSIEVEYKVIAAAGVVAAAVIEEAAVSAVSSGTLTLGLQSSGYDDASATEEPETLNQSNGEPAKAPTGASATSSAALSYGSCSALMTVSILLVGQLLSGF